MIDPKSIVSTNGSTSVLWTEQDAAAHLRLISEDNLRLALTDGMGSEQARRRVDCAVRRVRAYARRGAIPGAFKVGRVWRFRPDDVLAAEARWAAHGEPVDAQGKGVSAR